MNLIAAHAHTPRVCVQNLSKTYGTSPAAATVFKDVHLQVAAGELLAIMGDSGVGKSTLLNCLAGLDMWSSGHVLLQGTDLGTLTQAQLAVWRRAHVGFVFQAFHVLPHLSVAQNVALPLMLLARGSAAEQTARVQHMIDAVGLGTMGERLPQQLSGGQLQRVAIARALVHAPGLVLADEPTGNLDPETAARTMDVLVEQTRAAGASMVLVTHSPDAAARADRVVRLTATGIAPTALRAC